LQRGASSSKFLNYLNKHIIPVFDKLPEERKLDVLKVLAESSPYTTPQDSRQILPSVVQLLKKYMPRKKTGEETNFTYVECLLYAFHHLANKAPNATNSLCGYKIVTGQPSDRLGEDFSELYKDFSERLTSVEELTRATSKKLTQGMAEHNKAMSAAKSEEAKDAIKIQKQKATTGLRTCNNILVMSKVRARMVSLALADFASLYSYRIFLSLTNISSCRGKRPSTALNGSGNLAKKGRGGGGTQNQLVNRAFEGIGRGNTRGRGRGRGWGGRGRGRGGFW
ncbi:unnamed protein product, partial [Linum tenue]